MFKIRSLLAFFTLITVPFFLSANDTSSSINYGTFNFSDPDNKGYRYGFSTIFFAVGSKHNKGAGWEFRLGSGIGEEDTTFVDARELGLWAGIYGKYDFEIFKSFDFRIIAGYAGAKINNLDLDEETNASGFSYGTGLVYRINEKYSLKYDFSKYLIGNDDAHGHSIGIEGRF